jgi:hypothetical protein
MTEFNKGQTEFVKRGFIRIRLEKTHFSKVRHNSFQIRFLQEERAGSDWRRAE